MRTIRISDVTLRTLPQGRSGLSFREKVEVARTLDRLGVDEIELPPVTDPKSGVLSNKAIAAVVASARLTAAAGLTEESVAETWESVKSAKKPALHIQLPASAVQMEYMCHRKAPAMLELAKQLVARARYFTERVEFSALDATRAEPAFLSELIASAAEAGAETVTLCDSAGIMTAEECGAFIRETAERTPALKNVTLGVELSDNMRMAAACAAAAIDAGAGIVKAAIVPADAPALEDMAAYLKARGGGKGLTWGLRTTELARAASTLRWLLESERSDGSPFDSGVQEAPSVTLTAGDDASQVARMVRSLGYDLGEEDSARVYEAFQRIAARKPFVGARELDAIVASTAMQAPNAYTLQNYVITIGLTVPAIACVTLERDGRKEQSVAAGDGPVDAAFLAVEQILGRHFELDDFQIQTVTEGREAMGSALVKLRSNGRVYSGRGISTDVIGSSIRAYVSAVNKIVYEEA